MKSESKRSLKIKPNPTVEIKQKCAELVSKGEKIIDLSIGDTDFSPPESLKAGMINALDKGLTHYTLSQGVSVLRELIAEKHGVTKEEVLISAGGKEGIFSLFLSIVNEKDEVLFPEPAWPPYRAYTFLCQAKPRTIKTCIENEFEPSIDEMNEKITKKTKLLIINSPNNPSGAVYPRSFIKEAAALADDHGLILLSDEIYSNYDYSDDFISAKKFGENVVILDGFSKTFGMTGIRLCYLIAKKELVKSINKIHEYNIGNAPSLAQYAAIDILDEKEYMEKNKEEMKARCELAYKTIKDTSMLKIYKPKGAFYMFPEYIFQKPSADICRDLLLKKKVALVPGIGFGSEKSFRIAFSQPRHILKEGILRIREYFEEAC